MANRWPGSTRASRKSRSTCEGASASRSIAPALRFGDEKVAKRLDARDVFHLFGINEKTFHFRHVGLRQQANEPRIGRDAIVRQYGDADAMFDRPRERAQIVDLDMRRARIARVAPDRQQRIKVVEKMAGGGGAKSQQPMRVEIFDRAWLAVALQIIGRSVGVEVDIEQAASDEVRLQRLFQAQSDIGLAHAKIQFVV